MGRRGTVLGFVALLLLSSTTSTHGRSAALQRDAAASRALLNTGDDIVSSAQVPAACNPPANSSTLTKTGCKAGCQSCKKQLSSSGTRDCVCCKAGYVPSKTSTEICTACPIGQIARLAGSTSCTNCTRGLTTSKKAGATNCDGRCLKMLLLMQCVMLVLLI
jgi:hypothetical protein